MFWPFSAGFSPERCTRCVLLNRCRSYENRTIFERRKLSVMLCHVFGGSLVSILEAFRKRSLAKEKRTKKERYDEHFCHRGNRRTRNISCAQISRGWIYRFSDEPH